MGTKSIWDSLDNQMCVEYIADKTKGIEPPDHLGKYALEPEEEYKCPIIAEPLGQMMTDILSPNASASTTEGTENMTAILIALCNAPGKVRNDWQDLVDEVKGTPAKEAGGY